VKSPVKKLIEKHPGLTHSESVKVISHVQRKTEDEWFINTIMIDGYSVPFRYKRRKAYKNLSGQMVNLTYYPDEEFIGGIKFEMMRVVRIKVS
jgi:hypothetical protein